MSKTTRLQINVPVDLKEEFEKKASQFGMDVSSAIRFMMTQVRDGYLKPTIESSTQERLSPEAEARYDKMIQDVKSGKSKTYLYDPKRSLADQFNDIDDED